MRILLLSLLLFGPSTAFASAWCLVLDARENCRFLTAEECYTVTTRSGGYCKPNPRELGVRGNGPYCVITEGFKNCRFRNKRICLNVARQKMGGCVRNTELDLKRAAAGENLAVECQLGEEGCTYDFYGEGLGAAGYESSAPGPAPVEPLP